MITYIELWKSKQAWFDLSKEERGNYLTALGPAIQQLMESGVQIVSWGNNSAATFSRADYDYFAVWTFPNLEAAQNFEKMVEGAGWYNYFEQVNAMGNSTSPQEVMGEMINM
ncbi:hypothetical protein FRZ67_15220 [Panacibacter ginsenosidivorans]|uniref:NIPSNAP family containing protein n=1 Tax=Panacibacter ginsenosidivorans TaxID=1813871 RepID=A0A5B8VB74_9BACT|nr:DUF6616 family protein [Panacibacter ginsenosidivorans]QEC68592.1 hypothetical protein FRZ67_15220 [Panacibacter ginsenosidivorans]